MKTTIPKGVFVLLVAASVAVISCGGPNDNKGGMDTENSSGEGAVDSSRLAPVDTTGVMMEDTAR